MEDLNDISPDEYQVIKDDNIKPINDLNKAKEKYR